jgi:hypothetical protein
MFDRSQFLDNRYTIWYFKIIENRQINRLPKRNTESNYSEEHHIIPKSLGGRDRVANLVRLTAEEHFIVHHLLTKMTVGESKIKMALAFWSMVNGSNNTHQKREYRVNAKLYEKMKKELALYFSGENNPFYGKKHSSETLEKISKANSGRVWSEETRERRRIADSSEETKQKKKESTQRFWESERSNSLRERLLKANVGKSISEEHKKIVGEASRRSWADPNYRSLIESYVNGLWDIATLEGRERRKDRSEKYTGEGNPFFGKKHTDQTKRKISDNHGFKRRDIKKEDLLFDFIVSGMTLTAMIAKYRYHQISKKLKEELTEKEYRAIVARNNRKKEKTIKTNTTDECKTTTETSRNS